MPTVTTTDTAYASKRVYGKGVVRLTRKDLKIKKAAKGVKK